MKVLLTATVQSHICQFHKPLMKLLKENGYEVHVAARDNLAEKNGLAMEYADKVFDIPFDRSPFSTRNIKAYKELSKVLAQNEYEIIHTNTPMGGMVTRLAANKYRKKNGTKVFYTAHGFHFYKGAPKKNWIIYYPIEKFSSRLTDKLITITEEDYKLASKKFHCQVERIHGVGVDEKRYYPVDEAEKQRLREEMGYSDNQRIILNVGELLPNKNQQMAIHMMTEIIKQCPSTTLLIAGNGSEKNNLENLVSELGLQNNVKLLGYVTNLQDYQHIADVCVSCSKREGLPLNIVEAMMSGTPVVATQNRGHRELIRDGESGYLVSVDDTRLMASRVMDLLMDSELFSIISRNGIKRSKEYSAQMVKLELKTIYGDEFE